MCAAQIVAFGGHGSLSDVFALSLPPHRFLAQFVASVWLSLHTPLGFILVLLLIYAYIIHQELQIRRIRRRLADQLAALAEIEARSKEVYKMAVLDPLTGLHNRRFGQQRLMEEISRSERYGRSLIVLLFDIDELKKVNDNFGHLAGDQSSSTLLSAYRRRSGVPI